MRKDKLGGTQGLPGERLSLVHRYMTEKTADALTPEPEPARAQPPIAPLLAEASAPLSEPSTTPAVSAPLEEDTSEPRLPIHEWSRAETTMGGRRNDVDWPHELLRSRVARDRAGETPS
jgi:hypothetical protein